ncbi:outer membrane beta-barrel protein [bacterium]|nr:outer membrane beta-barrel protein [bacterium]
MLKLLTASLALLCFATPVYAGFIEIGASVNYRRNSIDENNYSDTTSYTGSISYYFWERSALELSYTSGLGKLSTKADGVDGIQRIQIAQFSMTSADIVLSLAGREDPFQPYFKFGAGYVDKSIFLEDELTGRVLIKTQNGVVPSAGIGLKVLLTKSLSIKLGVDAWTSPPDDTNADGSDRKNTIDYAGRAGLSWMF